jgi:hypothetical protein
MGQTGEWEAGNERIGASEIARERKSEKENQRERKPTSIQSYLGKKQGNERI